MRLPPVPADWASLPDEELLSLRMCDLPLRIEDTLAERTEQLRRELDDAGMLDRKSVV